MSQIGLSPKDVLVRAQDTPNPYALKFVCNFSLLDDGKITFNSLAEAEEAPLVRTIFQIPGVSQIYLFQNTITVTHKGDLDSDIMKEHVTAALKSRAVVHNSKMTAIEPSQPKRVPRPDHVLTPEMKQVEEILDRTIRPGLQADGGDLEVLSFENETIKILYQGACGGCPSAMMGTLDAIQNILRHEMDNQALIVVPV